MLSLKALILNVKLRYFIVVLSGFTLDFLIYGILVFLGVSIYVSNTISFSFGTIANVILIRLFVFNNNKFNFGTDLTLTFLSNGVMFGLGLIALWIQVHFLNTNPYWAKIFSNGLTFLLNFAIRSFFFRSK